MLTGEMLIIGERRQPDCRAADEYRLKLCTGGQYACPAYVRRGPQNARCDFFGRKLIGHCAARILTNDSECVVSRVVIELDHQSINLEVKIVALGLILLHEGGQRFEVVKASDLVANQETEIA